jgi:hypothetical protein
VRLDVSGDEELRPRIFRAASERGWVLWELHRERASLEQLFQELTAREGGLAAGDDAAGEGAR